MNKVESNSEKTWRFQLPQNMRKIIAAIVIFIVLPVFWQWGKHSWNLNATFVDVFAGDIDWSAWWGFGTFMVAVGAAVVAYTEYRTHQHEYDSHQRALLPQLVPILDITPSTDSRADRYHGYKLTISNVGGSIALRVKACWTREGEKPDFDSAPINASLLIGALRPDGEHVWFDHRGDESYPFPIDRSPSRDNLEPRDASKESTFTLYIRWEDTAGNLFEYPGKGIPFTARVKQVKHYRLEDLSKAPYESHIIQAGWIEQSASR